MKWKTQIRNIVGGTVILFSFIPGRGYAAELSCAQAYQSLAMEYVTLKDGKGQSIRVSRLVLGTDHLVQSGWTGPAQPEPSEQEAFRVLDEAARLGINFFDTAPIYVGGVENKLGKWRRSREAEATRDQFYSRPDLNPDRKLYVLSKGGFPFDLYWAKRLERGTHSPELKDELQRQGILPPGTTPAADGGISLREVPPGTYASRLYGGSSQIADRVAEELGHTRANLHDDVTLYLMHRDDGDAVRFKAVRRDGTPVKTILEGLGKPEISGRVWAIGWSNWKTSRVEESLSLAEANPKLPRPLVNSPYFSLFEMGDRSIHALGVQVTHDEMMNPQFQKGIQIMPYSPLGGFSILDKPAPQWENARIAAKQKYDDGDPYWQNVYPAIFTPENEARWHRVVAFTSKFNRDHGTSYTIDQMLNAYVLAHPRTDLLAIGAITVEQLHRTLGALELSKRLSPADLEYLYRGKR